MLNEIFSQIAGNTPPNDFDPVIVISFIITMAVLVLVIYRRFKEDGNHP